MKQSEARELLNTVLLKVDMSNIFDTIKQAALAGKDHQRFYKEIDRATRGNQVEYPYISHEQVLILKDPTNGYTVDTGVTSIKVSW